MKLKLTKGTITALGIICNYGLQLESPDKLAQIFMRTDLQSLIIKLARASMRISKALTLNIPPDQVLAFTWCMEYYNRDNPDQPEYFVAKEYFLSPILKQLA